MSRRKVVDDTIESRISGLSRLLSHQESRPVSVTRSRAQASYHANLFTAVVDRLHSGWRTFVFADPKCRWISAIDGSTAPFADLANGQIKARVWMPDVEKGFYQGTRFDWSGSVADLSYAGHKYFGQWFVRYDPAVRDVAWNASANGYLAGKASADVGPVEEFTGPGESAPGYDQAQPGDTFLKIGVGALRKPLHREDGRAYDHYFPYEIADHGKWNVRTFPDRVEFAQTVTESHGYAYEYTKILRLSRGKPEMQIEHTLKNTGSKILESNVYDHNFLVNQGRAPGPPLRLIFPFDLHAEMAMTPFAEASGRELRYLKTLDKDERAFTQLTGFGTTAADYDIRVENPATGAGVHITSDQPLSRLMFWSVKPVLAPEPFIHLQVSSGAEFRWTIRYEFYSVR